jgi:hypothetical protein
MQRGEADVLWPGRCALFALTAGTSTGEARAVPVTEELMQHVRRAGLDALLYYMVRARNAGVMHGRHLLFGGAPTLAPLTEAKPHQAYTATLSGLAALNLPAWAERHLYEPGTAVAALADWRQRLDGVVGRTARRDVTLFAAFPHQAALLAETLLQRARTAPARAAHLQALWPNLECFVHTGAPLAPYAAELRAALGPQVVFHEVYAATEGFVATQDGDARLGLRVMADLGVFFEFLPMADYDETRLAQLGPRTVPLSAVKSGVDYALVLTTPGGLARLVVGDVVRFVSTEPPRLVYVGGTRLRLDAFGERVTEKDITEAIVAVCQRRADWVLVNFHVAPLFAAASLTGERRGRHEWWVELKPGTVATPTGPQIAIELDAELQRLNETYAARRKSGILDAPFVRLVMPGVCEHWQRFRGLWGGQNKMPRCRSDRTVADELAQITNFARD